MAVSTGSPATTAWENVPAFLPGVQCRHVFQGTVGCGGEVGIPRGEQVKDTGLEIDVLHRHLLVALSVSSLQCVARPGLGRGRVRQAAPQDGRHLALPVINALAQGAAVHTQLQVLALLVGHGQVFRHADGEGQVATQLPHEHRGPYVASVHLHIAAALPLHDTQALGVAVPSAGAAIHKGSWQVICHSLVYFLICTLAVGFEDDGDLWEGTRTKFNTMGGIQDGASLCGKSCSPFWS
uniref:Uncharacterized protein n=1 Tax=Balaenoptera musculus TaxID=9771 RepID=A0A8C0HV82_BALMU